MSKTILIARSASGNSNNRNSNNNSSSNGDNKRKKSPESSKVTLITTLASSISHELRNDLAVIHVCAERSETELKNIREKAETQLKNIKERVKVADIFITNLQLQIKGIAKGKPSKSNFRLYSITQNIIAALGQYPFRDHERQLISIEKIEESQDFKYFGDLTLTNHILYNLIKNSLRAIKNADKGEITITLKPGKEFNKLTFKDTGSGIDKEFIPKIFDLFETQATKQGGSGIGLAFCKEIMRSYEGDITCKSKKDQYTEFVLRFPAVIKKHRKEQKN